VIYLELVPTDLNDLVSSSQWATQTFPKLTGINIPDILRVSHRSYDAVLPLSVQGIQTIPHIRTCDFSESDLVALCDGLLKNNGPHILLISGDPPPNLLQPVHTHSMTHIIKLLSTTFPEGHFYAAHDPYRQSLKDEFLYSEKKLAAGAKGLFTQPLFDPQLTQFLLNSSLGATWYIGISPVLTQPSFNYWVTRNHVVFRQDIELTMDYNIRMGRDILALCEQYNQHNYIMPIKTPLRGYLDRLLHD